ncbi:MAG: hypothetical protein WBF90_20350 [Rivularia sp. (in: cyanobacteria)]|jgi:hypothetical protein
MTIGKPFDNVKIYILDSNLNPVPIVLGFYWKDKTSFFKERIEYKLNESFQPLMPTLEKFMNEYELKALPGKVNVFVAT